ncbi:hypothetical protein LV779_36905 [Streptomyces thinghirensis]|nr:hypothetical protein [Streptomyces thinghirensis]
MRLLLSRARDEVRPGHPARQAGCGDPAGRRLARVPRSACRTRSSFGELRQEEVAGR